MKFNLADNAFTRALSKIFDLACLNVLWVICSIPIFTIGASTTALYSVMLKLVRNEEGYIFRGYMKAFKENFKQSTVIWLLILAMGAVWWIDYNFAGLIGGGAGTALRLIFLAMGILLLAVFIYVFPLTARYENSVKATLKNALLLSVAKLPYTILFFVIAVGAGIVSLWNVMTFLIAVPFWVFIGVSVVVWINSRLFRRIFQVFEEQEKDEVDSVR